MAEIGSGVWGTPTNFNGFCVLAALLHKYFVFKYYKYKYIFIIFKYVRYKQGPYLLEIWFRGTVKN